MIKRVTIWRFGPSKYVENDAENIHTAGPHFQPKL